MNSLAVFAYVLSVALLFVKTMLTTLVQAKVRLSTRQFQYAEDAECWQGHQVAEEAPLVIRAQRVLRNDSETQVFFLAMAGAYTALGVWPAAAPVYFGVYVSSRFAHTWYLLRPRQPHRNRAFALGVATLLALSVHCVLAAARAL